MKKPFKKGLQLIRCISKTMQSVPIINRRRNRILKLSLLVEYRKASNFLKNLPLNKQAEDWITAELFSQVLGDFYIKLFNSFFYFPLHLLRRDKSIYKKLKFGCEQLFELQDKTYSGFKTTRKSTLVAIAYADMLGTVASASISSLYCALKILMYRQVFFSIIKSFDGDVEVPIGDSLIAVFKEPYKLLHCFLLILPYILKNNLKVVIGVTFGDDFFKYKNGRPIIGRTTNLAIRLSGRMGMFSQHKSIKVKDYFYKKEYYLCNKIDTAIWIADYEDVFKKKFNTVKGRLKQIKTTEGKNIKLVEYIQDYYNISNEFNLFWRKIGYKKKMRIYAFIPATYLHRQYK